MGRLRDYRAGGINNAGTVLKLRLRGADHAAQVQLQRRRKSLRRAAAGADGNFYGTTESGGAHILGTVFKMTAGGTLTTLHSLTLMTALPLKQP